MRLEQSRRWKIIPYALPCLFLWATNSRFMGLKSGVWGPSVATVKSAFSPVIFDLFSSFFSFFLSFTKIWCQIILHCYNMSVAIEFGHCPFCYLLLLFFFVVTFCILFRLVGLVTTA